MCRMISRCPRFRVKGLSSLIAITAALAEPVAPLISATVGVIRGWVGKPRPCGRCPGFGHPARVASPRPAPAARRRGAPRPARRRPPHRQRPHSPANAAWTASPSSRQPYRSASATGVAPSMQGSQAGRLSTKATAPARRHAQPRAVLTARRPSRRRPGPSPSPRRARRPPRRRVRLPLVPMGRKASTAGADSSPLGERSLSCACWMTQAAGPHLRPRAGKPNLPG